MSGVLNKPRTSPEGSLKSPVNDVVAFGPFVFDRVNGLLWREGVEQPLPPRAVGVLVRLIDRAGDVVSKTELLDHVWRDTFVTDVSLTEAISLLRQVLDDDPQRPTYIQTLSRRGYRFVARLDAARETQAAQGPAGLTRQPDAATATAEPGVWPGWLPWVLTGVLSIALVAVSAGLLRQPGLRERPVARFSIDTRPVTLSATLGPALALSRDGTRLVSVAHGDAQGTRLYIRELARVDLRALPGTEDARAPFFSPDGRWVAFFADGRLKKVAVLGGDPITLCEAPQAGGGAWIDQGSIVFAGGALGGLSRVAENGGRVETVTSPNSALGEVRHLWPDAVPASRAVVFTGWPADGAPEAARVAVVSLDTGVVQTLVEGVTFGRASPTGHLLFVRDSAVLAAAFDADALVVQGPAKPVLTTVALDEARGVAQFAVAASGVLAQLTSSGDRSRETWRWGAGAGRAAMPFEGQSVRSLAYEGGRDLVAAAIGDGHRADIWVGRVDPVDGPDARVVRLTTSGHNAQPVWTHEGSAVVFASSEEGPFNLFTAPADASAPATRLTSLGRSQLPSSVSADGRLVYSEAQTTTGFDIRAMPLGDGRSQPGSVGGAGAATASTLVQDLGDQIAGVISPDGRWLTYQSNATGRWRARVRDLRATPVVDIELGASNGQTLAWNGNAVFFVDDAARLRECHATASTAFDCITLGDGVAMLAGVRAGKSGAPLVKSVGPFMQPQLEIVLEWSKELSAKVPIRPKEVRPVR